MKQSLHKLEMMRDAAEAIKNRIFCNLLNDILSTSSKIMVKLNKAHCLNPWKD